MMILRSVLVCGALGLFLDCFRMRLGFVGFPRYVCRGLSVGSRFPFLLRLQGGYALARTEHSKAIRI